MGNKASTAQRSADCAAQLNETKLRYQELLAILQKQLQAQTDALNSMKDGFLQQQADGGATLKAIQQLGLEIQYAQGQSVLIHQQIEDTQSKIQQLEVESTRIEGVLGQYKQDVEQCVEGQGFLTYKQQLMAGIAIAAISGLTGGLLQHQKIKREEQSNE